MRRWLTLVLLALLPLQFSWAAVATYCGHENDLQAQHLGHHQHQHQHQDQHAHDAVADSLDKADAPAGKTAGELDFDCGHCHGSCAGMPTSATALPGLGAAANPVSSAADLSRTRAPAPPERPQWAPLA